VFEEFHPKLQGVRANRVYTEMQDNDATVGAMLFVTEMITRQATWSIRPHSDDLDHVMQAEFVDSCRHDMSHTWDDFLQECLSFLAYGWSYFEEVYKVRRGPDEPEPFRSRYMDGKIGWRKIAIRGQDTLDRWELDRHGGVRGMWQSLSYVESDDFVASPVFIPIEKALLFRIRSRKNNPQGKSILRNAYRAWHMKKRIEELEGIGIERDLAGLPKGRVPPEILDTEAGPAEQAQKREFLSMITNLRRDEQEGVLIPALYDENGNALYDIELMTTGGRRQFDTDSIIDRWDHRIAMSILADFVLLGHKNVGSFAMSESKLHLFSIAVDSFLEIISDAFNQYAIPRLMQVNGWPVETAPKLVHGTVEEPNIERLGEYVLRLRQAGLDFTDVDSQERLRTAANLPAVAGIAGDYLIEAPDAAMDEADNDRG
jgi:hypothetical protein